MNLNLPNQLSIARCILAIVFVLFMSFTHWISFMLAYLVFTFAAITDYWDGKIARRTKSVTKFGQLIDPIADKVLMVAAFVMMMKLEELKIPGWCVVLIFAREFLITGVRTIAAVEGSIIPADPWGKFKTVLQMSYVFTFLLIVTLRRFYLDMSLRWYSRDILESFDYWIGFASLVSIILVSTYTIYSGLEIVWKNWAKMKMD
ncbi:MAG: CDP-diacylglycerol--glycerol-3-phosphate 3-phosphatidyltransferase [Candidatus Hydrogenedentes bacterium]|nr:CDP-diacylglycerol--glycerol-3-phosphate 3-phosphatidyltransferase [Candidatus Hydrogenedentota bacterium]